MSLTSLDYITCPECGRRAYWNSDDNCSRCQSCGWDDYEEPDFHDFDF